MAHERILKGIDYHLVETPARITRNTQANIRFVSKITQQRNSQQKVVVAAVEVVVIVVLSY